MSMNTVNLVGRLTKDVNFQYTNGTGKAVASFTLAVNRNFKNHQGEIEADFILCQAWGNIAQALANYTRKGSKLGITGRLQTRSYEKNNERVFVTEVIVSEIDFDKSQVNGNGQSHGQNSTQNQGQQHNNNSQNQFKNSTQPQSKGRSYNQPNSSSRSYARVDEDPFANNPFPDNVSLNDLPF